MTVTLIVLGIFVVLILLGWAFSRAEEPREVDEEEEQGVRDESPDARERSRFEQKIDEAAQRAQEHMMEHDNDTGD